jgi:uncharacterized protein (DUF1778 family)
MTDGKAAIASTGAPRGLVQTIHLSPEDQRCLVELILDPPPPSPALMRAAESHRSLMKS